MWVLHFSRALCARSGNSELIQIPGVRPERSRKSVDFDLDAALNFSVATAAADYSADSAC